MTTAQRIASKLVPLRASLAMALLAAIAALTGAQALAAAPASAAVNMGEECDPSYPTLDCEPTNGGGGGSSGSNDGGSTDGDQIIGEAIYVEGTAPASPCGAFCLPSQTGRSRTGFLDRGGKDPRAPRPRGRLTRVGEVAKGKAPAKKPSLSREECVHLLNGGAIPLTNVQLREIREISAEEEKYEATPQFKAAFREWVSWDSKGRILDREIKALNAMPNPDPLRIQSLREQRSIVVERMDAVERGPAYVPLVRLGRRLEGILNGTKMQCREAYAL